MLNEYEETYGKCIMCCCSILDLGSHRWGSRPRRCGTCVSVRIGLAYQPAFPIPRTEWWGRNVE